MRKMTASLQVWFRARKLLWIMLCVSPYWARLSSLSRVRVCPSHLRHLWCMNSSNAITQIYRRFSANKATKEKALLFLKEGTQEILQPGVLFLLVDLASFYIIYWTKDRINSSTQEGHTAFLCSSDDRFPPGGLWHLSHSDWSLTTASFIVNSAFLSLCIILAI